VTFRVLSPAQKDLASALEYYDDQSKGLGADFLDELEAAIGRVLAHPNAWRKISENHRCCRMRRFPFGVIYSIESNVVLISAIMDLHRNPEEWNKRL